MTSPQKMKSIADYLKEVTDCKHEISTFPLGCDTPEETALKRLIGNDASADAVAAAFQKLVYGYDAAHHRDLPWRKGTDPYRILVSEVMLQQTQVERVIPKFMAFLARFPDIATLANAPLNDLLEAWQGLGYNRRALNLQRAARMILEEWNGTIADDPVALQRLPGIGPYTAGAVCAFAFNRPQVFLETNIRAVLLHFFFADQQQVADKQLLPIAAAVLDSQHPRNWYNALMDYGSDLKRRFPNPSRRSRQHTVQSRFEGSDRQIRGAVLRLLLEKGGMTAAALEMQLGAATVRLEQILTGLLHEGFLKKQGRVFKIP